MSAARKPPRPFVTANFALTWDARVSTRNRTPADFSSKTDKHRLLEIRATGDAILVGAGTVKADNMAMGLPDEALRAERIARNQSEYPLRVIITNSGKLDPDLKLFQGGAAPILIFSTQRMSKPARELLAGKATLYLDETPTVDLSAMMTRLRRDHGVRRLVCEGGPVLFKSLLVADLVDELHVTFCPRIFGGEQAATLTGIAAEFLPESTRLTLRKMEVIDGECFLQYRILR
ncbi:MAG: ribD2 [Chthoniobacteraceae bacterium]|nr:ribD2 [Chthoniobacteraceae bacterium]